MTFWDPVGYGLPPDRDTKGSTDCDLHIPHPAIGAELAEAIGHIGGVTVQQRKFFEVIGRKIDENFNEIQRHHAYFYRNCICHCREESS